jgi:hypothetical protein
MRQDDVERRRKAPDRTEVFLQFVAEIFVKRLAERVVGVGLKDRVAVRDGFRGGCSGDRSSAPARFITTTGCPRILASASAMMRPTMSGELPGELGTI